MEEVKEEIKESKKEKKKHGKENEEIELLKKQVVDLQTKLMYSQADLINFRKRSEEHTSELLKYKNEALLCDLTDMIENLDRAASVKTETEEGKKIQVGINMVNNQFKEILKKYDVEEIEAVGFPFDPNTMEAMMVTNDNTKPDDMVVMVLSKGYKYKDKVLKHAKVSVNKNEEQIKEKEEMKGNE